MNNLCFGMKVLNITQVPGGSLSHRNQALDLAGVDSGIDFWFAQGRWRCIGKWNIGSNTYFFTHVDAQGNTAKIHCADGIDRVVTIALTHSNLNFVNTIVGKMYEDGEAMYQEGTYGNADGNHIHLEIAEGIRTTKSINYALGYYYFNGKLNPTYTMQGELNPLDVFFVNDSFTKVKNAHGADLKHVSSIWRDEDYDMKLKVNTVKGAQYVRESLSFKNGKPNGKILVTVPKNNKDIIITAFVNGLQADGYQWVKVKYGNIEGYAQWDSKYFTVYEY